MNWIENHPFEMGIISAILCSLVGALIFAVNSSGVAKPNWSGYWVVAVPFVWVFFLVLGFGIKKINEKNDTK